MTAGQKKFSTVEAGVNPEVKVSQTRPIISEESERILYQATRQFQEERARAGESELQQGRWQVFRRGVVFSVALTFASLTLLLAHGLLTEGEENRARFAHLSGDVLIKTPKPTRNTGGRKASTGSGGVVIRHPDSFASLLPGDTQLTGRDGRARLTFPDGSALEQSGETSLGIRALDYFRTGRRERRFSLNRGRIDLLLSSAFGAKSEARILTPDSLVRASLARFSVQHTPGKQTLVDVVEGTVLVETGDGSLTLHAGQRGVISPSEGDQVVPLPEDFKVLAESVQQQLAEAGIAPGLIQGAERELLSLLDPLLQAVGLPSAGPNRSHTDAARLTAASVALRRLQEHLASRSEVPASVNPVTLAELELPSEVRLMLEESLVGGTILGYERRGATEYTIYARARDSRGTPFELTEAGPKQLTRVGL